ncbi:MAG: hypothetical protein ACK4K0_10370 [Flavobacteriales bacterium]
MQSSFEKQLREFFMKHDPGRLRLAAKIAKKFNGNRKDVLNHLEKIYKSGGVDKLKPIVEKRKLQAASRPAPQPQVEAVAVEQGENNDEQ